MDKSKAIEFKKLSDMRLNSLSIFFEHNLLELIIQDYGYPVELALKSVICKKYNLKTYPPKKYFKLPSGEKIPYKNHNLSQLVQLADLENDLSNKMNKDTIFAINWIALNSWDINNRYTITGSTVENARYILNAITNKGSGVYQWITQYL